MEKKDPCQNIPFVNVYKLNTRREYYKENILQPSLENVAKESPR